MARNFEASLQAVGEFGTLEQVSLPDLLYQEVVQTISAAEAYGAFDDFIAAGRTLELTARKAHGHRLAGAVLPAHDYIRAQGIGRIVADTFVDLAEQFDALLAPSLDVVAGRNDEDFGQWMPRASDRRSLNLAGVLAGTPTVPILIGLGQDDLPTGIQLAGAPLRGNFILDAARALEEQTAFKHLRPKVGTLEAGRDLARQLADGGMMP